MEFLNEYVVAIVLVGCLCAGYIIKHVVPSEKINSFIPAIVGVLGVFLNVWLNQWTLSPAILVGGLVSGLASTGLHQAFKQFVDHLGKTE